MICRECDKDFKPEHRLSMYCSPYCKELNKKRRELKKHDGPEIIKCSKCDKDFKRRAANNLQCTECRDKTKEATKKIGGGTIEGGSIVTRENTPSEQDMIQRFLNG